MATAPRVLVLTPSLGGYYFGSILGGIARTVGRRGGHVVVVQTLELGSRADELGDPPPFQTPVGWDDVDGAVAITAAVPQDYLLAVQEAGRPVVAVSTSIGAGRVARVLPDNRAGTRLAVEHLIAHGHTRIGFAGNLAQADILDRYRSFVETMHGHGLAADPGDLYRAPDMAATGGAVAAAALLARPDLPTAVMAASDRNALGLVAALESAGVSVPDDVAVASFDDIERAAYSTPRLTTVHQSFEQLGIEAAELVLERARTGSRSPVDTWVAGSLVVRESCGCRAEHGRSDTVVHRSALDELLLDAVGASGAVAGPLRTAAPGLRDWGPPELRRAARTLGDRLGPDDPRLARLHHLESQAFTAETSALDEAFEEQFAVDTGLLGSGSADPRSLAWLTRTHVTSAVLALWRPAGSAELSTVGVHDPAGGLQHLLGTTAGVRSFPPSALVERASAGSAEVCVVVPVRSPDRDWGLLALVSRVDTASARETYHHWGTLLAASLERMALQDAVATSERRYATAARATNEGLWEWDLDRDSLYLSGRGRALIGLDGDDLDLAAVLRQVHAGDREAVRSALAEVRVRVGRPTEVEFRVGEDSPRWLLFRGLGVSDDGAEVARVVGSVADIGPRKQLEERLRQAAMYDPVTGLANRRLFTDRLADAIRRHERDPSRGYAVVFLDLDGFKLVNDSLGHPAGDVLLRAVADRLSSGLRAGDTAARFGGDEFAVLLADPEPEDLLLVAERLAARVAAPVELGAERVSVTASIGITTSGERVRDTAQVMRDADIAMYHAKESAPGTAALFDRAMHDRAERRLHLHTELNAALEHSQFAVHYQPIVSLDGSPVTRFEALLRWHHPERGLLPPAEFLQALTDGPLIVTLGEWVLDRVCAQIAQWRAERGVVATVSVNLSHREFWSPGLVRAVSDALACHGVGAESLALEITETVVMTDVPAARERMRALRDLGVRLHVDDFGTGTSSLHALRSFPVDALKIDGAFVRDLPGNDQTAKLVAVIVEMGRALGVRVIAECVENDLQADFLRSHGCPDAQGWLFGHAMPGDAAGALLGRVPD